MIRRFSPTLPLHATAATALIIGLGAGLTSAAQAETPLAGTYAVQGIAANGSVSYSGKTTVTQTGQTYRVEWSLNGGREQYIGTGVRSGDSFAVVYTAPKTAPNATANAPGLVLYTIQPNGSLTGYYTTHGARSVSAEAWNPGRF